MFSLAASCATYLESGGNVGEVGNAAADQQHFAVRMRCMRHQTEHSLRVLVSLLLAGRTAVFAVIGKFVSEAQIANSVSVNR